MSGGGNIVSAAQADFYGDYGDGQTYEAQVVLRRYANSEPAGRLLDVACSNGAF